MKISVFLEINVTAPRRLIPVSGDRVTSADDTMKIWISVSVYILVYIYICRTLYVHFAIAHSRDLFLRNSLSISKSRAYDLEIKRKWNSLSKAAISTRNFLSCEIQHVARCFITCKIDLREWNFSIYRYQKFASVYINSQYN